MHDDVKEPGHDENVMPKIDGKSFRCECGCNVFHRPRAVTQPNVYECNGCGEWYEGTPAS